MGSHTDRIELADGFAEIGTITHNGREFSAVGAMVRDGRAVGYPKFDRDYTGAVGQMQTWDGQPMGTARIVSMWRVWSWAGSHMCQIEATIGGKRYTGRGFGSGMMWRGKLKAS